MKLIYEMLAGGKEISIAEINKEAIERGISERTVRLARNQIKNELGSERRGKDWWIWIDENFPFMSALYEGYGFSLLHCIGDIQ